MHAAVFAVAGATLLCNVTAFRDRFGSGAHTKWTPVLSGWGGVTHAQPGQVCWRYLFGADCYAEERTDAFACALCPLQCCSFQVRHALTHFCSPP